MNAPTMNAETGGGLTALREAVATRLDDLNACGYLVYPNPNTGEPMQEQVPVDYLAAAVMDVLAARLADRDAVLARVEAVLSDARKIQEHAYKGAARQFAKAWGDVIDRALHPAPSEDA